MSYDSEIFADAPVAYWKLQSLVPPSFPIPNLECIDSFGAHNGTLFPNSVGGIIQGIPGPIITDANSYLTGGGSSYIPNPGFPDPILDLRGAQSWECWAIKQGTGTETTLNRGGDASTTYLSYGQRSTGNFADNAYWVMSWDGGGFEVGRDLISCVLSSGTHHLVVTYDGIDTMLMYVDSWLVASRNDCPPAPTFVQQIPWRLGYMTNFAFGAVNLTPGLGYVAIYDKVLTPDRIIAHNVAALGVRASNPCGPTPLDISCPTTDGRAGDFYSSTLVVTGGTAPFTFAVISGALPDGLSLDTSTGVISGTPTSAGSFSFVIRVTDAVLDTADTPSCGITVAPGPIPPPEPPISPPIETCPENEAANLGDIQRVQRVLDFTQNIQRNLQHKISSTAPLILYGYSFEWTQVSVSELTEQRNAYASSWQFAEWGHLFQAYVAYISTADITWNITVDGVGPDSYLLPSTGGSFVKQWIILRARKGKLFDWSFSSTAEFQIIPSQSVLLAKEFKTQGAYQQLQPFGDQT